MAPDQVRKALRAVPFRPFSVEVAGGRRVQVKHTDYAQLSPAGRTLVVFTDDDDAAEIIDVFLITSLNLAKTPARRK
jgi:hypothetical protein